MHITSTFLAPNLLAGLNLTRKQMTNRYLHDHSVGALPDVGQVGVPGSHLERLAPDDLHVRVAPGLGSVAGGRGHGLCHFTPQTTTLSAPPRAFSRSPQMTILSRPFTCVASHRLRPSTTDTRLPTALTGTTTVIIDHVGRIVLAKGDGHGGAICDPSQVPWRFGQRTVMGTFLIRNGNTNCYKY